MAFVQQTEGANTGSGTSIAATAITTTSGNRLVAFVTYLNASQQTITLSDSQGNTWNAIGSQLYDTGDDQGIQCFEATVTSAGSTTITATFGAASTFRGILVVEHSNAAGNVDNDGDYNRQSNPGTGTDAVVSASSTNSAQPALHIGFTFDWNANAAPSSGTGFTSRTAVWSAFGAACARSEDRSLSSTGTQTATFTTASGTSTFYTASVIILESNSSVDQEGFRWGVDDGIESAHTWEAAQDTSITIAANQSRLLRLLLNATGDPASTAYALRYQKNGSGGYVAVPVGASTSPTLSWGAAGTIAYSASGGGSVAPTYPSGITTNSCLVLVVGQKPSSANGGTCTTPSGWTLRAQNTGATDGDTGGYTTTLAADQGNTNIYVYTKDSVTGSESGTLSVTVGTNNVCWANIYRVESSAPCTWGYDSGVGKDTSAGNVSIATGNVAISSGDFILGGMVIPTDVSTPSQFSSEALSQSGTTFGTVTEVEEPDSGTGNDIGGFVIRADVSSGSGSGAVTMTATAGGTTTNVRGPGFVLRIRASSINNEVYVATSANIAAGGEATTARLTAPSGKSTSDFVTGRRWDDENGSDSIDITTDDYTEVEWLIALSSAPTGGDYFDFRAYAGAAALTSYTETPRWTVGAPVVASVTSRQRIATNPWGPFLISRRETRSYGAPRTSVYQPIGLAEETDSAFSIGRSKLRALGLNTETDAALSIAKSKVKALGLISETDEAQALARSKAKVLGLASESSEAQTLARLKTKALGLSIETDEALALESSGNRTVQVGLVEETDTAQPLARAKLKAAGLSSETDEVLALTRVKSRAIGLATETDTAFSLARLKAKLIGLATEVDSALALVTSAVSSAVDTLFRLILRRR